MDLRSVARPVSQRVPPSLLDRAETLPGALAELAQHHPDFECLFILDGERRERRYTTAALWAKTRQAATRFIAHGLKPGDTVAIVLPTGPELISAYFGALLAGGVPALASIPLNRVADGAVYRTRLGAIIGNAGARILYCAAEVAELFLDHADALPEATGIVTSSTDSPAATAGEFPSQLARRGAAGACRAWGAPESGCAGAAGASFAGRPEGGTVDERLCRTVADGAQHPGP